MGIPKNRLLRFLLRNRSPLDRKSDRTPATTSTNYRPNPAQIKDFADFSVARHRSLTITEP
ncbi:hypothetical protein [Microcoleus sp. F4-D5]|uniref:hypothetical protein n=1 Tax=Microcoleus sp. F4-D5 TaxID=2818760 RepID=UPI002FD18E87